LLLSDYLTRCYERGGVIAVLALESLFQLIVKFNLDYPDFFVSLYRMCTPEVFSAKYRTKFLRLLTLSLQSTNLSAHVVAAFVKRFAHLSLNTPSPCALFCVAQITTLLRRHPQCIQLIHRSGTAGSAPFFDNSVDGDLEKSSALSSSLWEMNALQAHHLHGVVALAKSLEQPASTLVGRGGTLLNMDEFLDHNYADLMEAELKKLKKNAPLNFRNCGVLLPEGDITAASFGSL
jgi:U3 small nucleolar RNA-associated protein 19